MVSMQHTVLAAQHIKSSYLKTVPQDRTEAQRYA